MNEEEFRKEFKEFEHLFNIIKESEICPKCGGYMNKEGIECLFCGFSRC